MVKTQVSNQLLCTEVVEINFNNEPEIIKERRTTLCLKI